MYKKIIISILVVLVSLFSFLAIYTKGFHPNYQNYENYIEVQSTTYEGERITTLARFDGEYDIIEYDGGKEIYNELYIYYRNDVNLTYELVNDEKIPVYHFNDRYYIQIKDIKNTRVW